MLTGSSTCSEGLTLAVPAQLMNCASALGVKCEPGADRKSAYIAQLHMHLSHEPDPSQEGSKHIYEMRLDPIHATRWFYSR